MCPARALGKLTSVLHALSRRQRAGAMHVRALITFDQRPSTHARGTVDAARAHRHTHCGDDNGVVPGVRSAPRYSNTARN